MHCTIERHEQGSRTRLDVSGYFDVEAAAALREALELEEADEVVIDFTAVARLDDIATWVIAEEVRHGESRLEVRGLSAHHIQLLRYLRVDPAEVGATDTGADLDA